MVKRMARDPLILALANPEPEILPELAKAVAARRHPRHRPVRLPEPGEQRPLLSVHLPRRARRGRHDDHRGDEARVHARHRRARARRAVRHRRAGLRGRGSVVRSGVPDPEAVRSAAHGDRAAGRGEGRDGKRRGHAADRRFRRVSRAPVAVHLPLEPHHEAGVRGRQARTEARRLCRGRGGARAARRAGRRRRRAGEAGADRASGGHRRAHREVRIAPSRRHGLRARQHQQRSALPRVLAALLPAHGAQGHLAGGREGGRAAQALADRHVAAAHGRLRRAGVRDRSASTRRTCATSRMSSAAVPMRRCSRR